MTLFWDQTGPLVKYDGETLTIDDLNPEQHMCWRVSRWELFKLGMKAIAASFKR